MFLYAITGPRAGLGGGGGGVVRCGRVDGMLHHGRGCFTLDASNRPYAGLQPALGHTGFASDEQKAGPYTPQVPRQLALPSRCTRCTCCGCRVMTSTMSSGNQAHHSLL